MGEGLFEMPAPAPMTGGTVLEGTERTIAAVSKDPDLAERYAGLMASARLQAIQADNMGQEGRPSGRAQFFKTLNDALTTLAEAPGRETGGTQLDATLRVIMDADTATEDAQGDDL